MAFPPPPAAAFSGTAQPGGGLTGASPSDTGADPRPTPAPGVPVELFLAPPEHRRSAAGTDFWAADGGAVDPG